MKIDREKVWSSVEYTIQSLSKYNTLMQYSYMYRSDKCSHTDSSFLSLKSKVVYQQFSTPAKLCSAVNFGLNIEHLCSCIYVKCMGKVKPWPTCQR